MSAVQWNRTPNLPIPCFYSPFALIWVIIQKMLATPAAPLATLAAPPATSAAPPATLAAPQLL